MYQDKRKGKIRRVYFLLFHGHWFLRGGPQNVFPRRRRVRGNSGRKDLSTLFKLRLNKKTPRFGVFTTNYSLILYSLTLMMFMYFIGTLNSAPSSLTMHFSESVSPVITPFLYPVTSFHCTMSPSLNPR